MKILPTSLLAGAASLAFIGMAAAHTLTVQLPDGTTERIDYAGNVAPQISLTPPQAVPITVPGADWGFAPQSPFALMQQIAVQMDRQADAMMRQMQQIAAQPVAGPGQLAGGQPIPIDMTKLPPGTQSYSFVSTLSPSGVCSQSTEIVSKGPGQKPQVITHSSGNCGALGAATNVAAPDQTPATQSVQPHMRSYQAKAIDHPDYRRMFREASW